MAYDLKNRLVVGVSSRTLFDLSYENKILEEEGVEAYSRYQVEHEDELLRPGPGFPLVRALLNLNELPGMEDRVEVIIMSRNSPDASLRIFKAIEHYDLRITRAVLAGGASLAPYLTAFKMDLFLSACEEDVQRAIDSNIAAGIICTEGIRTYDCEHRIRQIRIAFDGDAVLFSDESERIFKEKGLEAFEENEKKNAGNPLQAGPFAKFLKTLSELQENYPGKEAPIRTALVTTRCAPAHERVIRTLRAWDVRIDEVFFLGGIRKRDVLQAFGAHIFFDDQQSHTLPASKVVPSARVPYKNRESAGEVEEKDSS